MSDDNGRWQCSLLFAKSGLRPSARVSVCHLAQVVVAAILYIRWDRQREEARERTDIDGIAGTTNIVMMVCAHLGIIHVQLRICRSNVAGSSLLVD